VRPLGSTKPNQPSQKLCRKRCDHKCSSIMRLMVIVFVMTVSGYETRIHHFELQPKRWSVDEQLQMSWKKNLYCCTVHFDINVYVHQLMHLFISPRQH
jgi:hypothetical protein